MQLIPILSTLTLLFSTSLAAYDANSKNNVAVYWGQGSNQESLGYYCERGDVDIVVISFINYLNSTYVGFNFGNACWGPECPLIAADIKKCQALGIKVSLSIGGDERLGDYGCTSDADGEAAAQMLYDMFSPNGNPKVTKPFGDVTIDGFDLDIENFNQKGQIAMFKKLRKLFAKEKTLILSACPQCPYPDSNVNDVMVDEEVQLDLVFMQFYSNAGCSMNNKDGFANSWKTWANFMENVTNSKDMKMYVTLQASKSNEYHTNVSWVNEQLKGKMSDSFFGGIGLWDATVATECTDTSISGVSQNYIQGMKNLLSGVYSSLVKRDEL
ncbi:hypothetical protein DASC09_045910 [Saccharomycopsis crataegensis]|uniref:chitinase n=1 Tax=Saccharomycopsis crataegensis TaxID=43959 RepID=A0AAV5QRU4_9ASCO|nr:hypothetical protein DASC09_045910 [Saccharomycopsis crataegensis]